jgi:hypothetical protein
MTYMINHPRVLALLCLLVMWLMACAGLWIGRRKKSAGEEDKGHLALVVSATLTLLGLIIGFTFSMASTRYDQRRLYEEQEANAIGTEYVRADLLPPDQAAMVKQTLLTYLDWRIGFYSSDYGEKVHTDDQKTVALQATLWQHILPQAHASPNPVTALVVSGMNDVLNSQGYTQFSWWNRIPGSAWGLMIVIAAFSNLLVGYAAQRSHPGKLLLALPLIVSISFFLISDIDSPRGGIIRIPPVDLISLSQQLHAQTP